MSLAYLLRPKAEKDIDDIADELAERVNLDAGLNFLTASYETFGLVATQPEMGWHCRLRRPELKNLRVFRVSKPFEKYLIFYLPLPGQIEILRVLHGAQDIEQRLWAEGVL